MASKWVWRIVSGKTGCTINMDRFNKKGRDDISSIVETFKRLIQREQFDEAFDVIDNLVTINIISVSKRDQLAKDNIPFLSDC